MILPILAFLLFQSPTQLGLPSDLPVPADYDGDGIVDLAVWRPSNAVWYIRPSSDPTRVIEVQWGLPGDIPVQGGKLITVFRPALGMWFSRPAAPDVPPVNAPAQLPAATAATLGGVMVPDGSGLSVSGGALSVVYGSGPNTAAQGNDSRILGALQSANNLGDLISPAVARANLKLATVAQSGLYTDLLGLPNLSKVAGSGLYSDLSVLPTIPTDTKQLLNGAGFLGPLDNAASATKFAAIPSLCAAGKYAIGVNALGNATCVQVLYSQLGSIPPAYSLPQATSTLLGGIMAGTGLNVASGMAAVKYGTGAGTAAQGNDSRILGASQKSNNLNDLADLTTALQNLKLLGTTPLTIAASTTGNAATATRAGTAGTLQGSGILRMRGTCGPFPFTLGVGERGAWFDTDCNLHLRDQANLNRSVMFQTWINGVEQKCKPGYAMVDVSASGAPVCLPFLAPTGTASNTDNAGQLTLADDGTGKFTASRVFAGTYVSAPICTANDTQAVAPVQVIATGGANAGLTLVGTAADAVNYNCWPRN